MDGARPETPLDTADRQAWMGLAARGPAGRLVALLDAAGPRPEVRWLRRPETGSVMVRARAGAVGTVFNLGEMTVTRGALEAAGHLGHGWVQGRDRAACEAAAIVDALMQGDGADRLRPLLDALAREEAPRRAARAGRAAATRVDFLTMARGD